MQTGIVVGNDDYFPIGCGHENQEESNLNMTTLGDMQYQNSSNNREPQLDQKNRNVEGSDENLTNHH